LPIRLTGAAGIAIIALHNLTNFFQGPLERLFGENGPNWFLCLLYFGGGFQIGGSGPPLLILYVIVPWIGVMMAGYAFGLVMEMPEHRRRAFCLRLGVTLVVLFIVLRALDFYGDPRPWSKNHTFLGFLNTTKYPASLLFLLMTLGPMFILLGYAERMKGKIAGVLETFGRVPMFYYLLHIPLIHVAACIVSLVREGHVDAWLYANHPLNPGPVPAGYMWSLGLLYLVFAVCVTVLYFPCRWYARVRAERRSKWLSYL
jgi:uncharacterized membrane protein